MATKKGVRRNGAASLGCLFLSIPMYFIYRNNLEYEWLFNTTAASGMFLMIFRVFAPLMFTHYTKHEPGLLHWALAENRFFRKYFVIQDGDPQ